MGRYSSCIRGERFKPVANHLRRPFVGDTLATMSSEQLLQDIAGFEESVDHVRTQNQLSLAQPIQQVFQDVGHIREVGKPEGSC